MNKLAMALSAALSLGAAASASASTGTVNFTGRIVADACSVAIGGGTGTATVALRPITKEALAADAEAGRTRFDVKLTSGAAGAAPLCAGDTSELLVRKAGLTADGRIANTHVAGTGDPAAGVVVQLLRVNGSSVDDINLQSDSITAATTDVGTPPATTREANFTFEARYLSDGGPTAMQAGTYTGQMIFDVSNY
ncbi:TPA: fimbrial protein [Stenotrophomonas maltophilia]|uniref:fimbrial protein n=1 Tax=Stenotrophomonas sp. PE591 TaxID=1812490 RepID=UPI001BAEDBCA|nr:type 1 fimbrial protein [Stenotrophomonas sp. PE591]MBS3726915.1 hypothetical protein [Stenotrophomonas sp. PE591]